MIKGTNPAEDTSSERLNGRMTEPPVTCSSTGRRKRRPLLRRHTLEIPPSLPAYGSLERQVVRAASEERWAASHGSDSAAEASRKGRLNTFPHRQPAGLISLEVRAASYPMELKARRLAWSGPPTSQLEANVTETSLRTVRHKTHTRPKSCVTPVSTLSCDKEALNQQDTKTLPPGSEKSKRDTVSATFSEAEVKPQVSGTDGEHLKNSTKVIRSASSPDLYFTGVSKEPIGIDSKHELEPYNGLVIQKAPLVSQIVKSRKPVLDEEGDEADEEDNASDTQIDTRLRGYKSRHGFGFIPFSKMFTKPHRASLSRRSSRSSQEEPELGLENSLLVLSESERDIIKKTRSDLKQRISSANRKIKNGTNKKIQLSIVVGAQEDFDESAQVSERDSEVSQRLTRTQDLAEGKETKTKQQKSRECEVPTMSSKSANGHNLQKKKSSAKPENKVSTKVTKKMKKKEIPTIMSEISPVASDVEQHYGRQHRQRSLAGLSTLHSKNKVAHSHENNERLTNVEGNSNQSQNNDDGVFAPARGGFLRTIINESNMYAPVNQTWRGTKMHLEVRISTERATLSTEDEEDDVSHLENRRGQGSEKRGRTPPHLREDGCGSAGTPTVFRTMQHRGTQSLLFPTPTRPHPQTHANAPASAVHRAKERDKLRQVLEVCTNKVKESQQLRRRLGAAGVWVSLDTLQKGLMSPTEYRVYQDHLKSLEEKEQQRKKPARTSTSFVYKR
ncbi:uncharacterized protein [Cherax quadricarinatus]|uniref:uncharacterized protein n=1 Tax=Cherax quadricarinatus TaxID=27406 RepID=UPI002377DDF0|nr:uncharacterized protein LOC128686787 [Cherax quadricarinatus]